MYRIALPGIVLAAFVAAACSGSPEGPVAPTSALPPAADAAGDGSTLKATAPKLLSPINNVRLQDRRPTLRLENSTGLFVGAAFSYEFVVRRTNGQVVRSAIIAGGPSTTAFVYPVADELEEDTQYRWQARAVLDGAQGPWSDHATFRTAEGIKVPPQCNKQPIEANRLPCVAAVAKTSKEWQRCTDGNGVACHRFAREVAAALAVGDPRWGLLGKPPSGQWQCTDKACGSNSGGEQGYGEDIAAYCTNPATCQMRNRNAGRTDWFAVDMIKGAGAKGATLSWSAIPRKFNRGNNFWAPVPKK